MGTDAVLRLALKPYQHHLGGVDVPGVAKELLYQLAAAFSYTHAAQGAVAGMGVGSQHHLAAAGNFLAHILVDDCLICRNIDTTVLLCCRKAEHVVVFVDRTAYRAKGVVAVGHGVGDGEFLQTAGTGCLNDADIGNVMGSHGIEEDAHFLALSTVFVVAPEDAVSDGVFAGFVGCDGSLSGDGLAVEQINTVIN